MAASSPALSSNSNDTTGTPTSATAITTTTTTVAATAGTVTTPPTTNASKNLRGLNKPKCIKCGNVARSRCPYQSCKSCCAKAQNPCHIHVLKASATFPEKSPSSSSPLFDQQSTEASPSGNSHRVASLRQLSNNFAQFNNLQTPLRSRKPLTRKDATVINEWRFLKLKEYRDRNIEAENEAFDRYMQNVHLLEEVFKVNSTSEGPTKDKSSTLNPNPVSTSEGPTKVFKVNSASAGPTKDESSTLNPNPDSTSEGPSKDESSTFNPNPDSTSEGPTKGESSTLNPNPDSISEGPTKDESSTLNPNPDSTSEGPTKVFKVNSTSEGPTKDESSTLNSNPDSTSEGPSKDESSTLNPNPDSTSEGPTKVFKVNSMSEGPTKDDSSTLNLNPDPVADGGETMIYGLKLKLRSNPVRTENCRKRMLDIVDDGLRKLRKLEENNGHNNLNEQDELIEKPKMPKPWREERASAFSELSDKLNKARNEDDLKSCLEMKSQLFSPQTKTSQVDSEDIEISKQQTANNDSSSRRQSDYSPTKWLTTTTIDQDALNRIDVHFSSLEEIEDL
ncbi:cell wall protein DAN4 [Cornus florida]|uniref:cell wall protein DAN4 n=1 Tax=Cornus florida TaxID=4283 RepID=UPI00289A8393|nr:cell wall protein DAN4 [Cornus florida]